MFTMTIGGTATELEVENSKTQTQSYNVDRELLKHERVSRRLIQSSADPHNVTLLRPPRH